MYFVCYELAIMYQLLLIQYKCKNNLNCIFKTSAAGDGQQSKVMKNQNRRIAQTTTSASRDCEYQMADSAHKTCNFTTT